MKPETLEKLTERCIEREAKLSIITESGSKACFIAVMDGQDKYCKYQNMGTIHYTDKGLKYGCDYVCPYSKMSKRISNFMLNGEGC